MTRTETRTNVQPATPDTEQHFKDNPEQYEVAYGGWCATAMAFDMEVEADPENFLVREGRVFFFADDEARQTFLADPEGLVAKADAAWEARQK